MTTTPITRPGGAATALRVHSVSGEEGLIWALTDGRNRLVGTAAAAVREPISAADGPAADLEIWVAPDEHESHRWDALVPQVLDALRLLEIPRIETRCDPTSDTRLAQLVASGFRVAGVERDGTLRLVIDA